MKAGQSLDLKCQASVGFEVLMMVTANITVFWGVILYSLVAGYERGGVWHHIQKLSYFATVQAPGKLLCFATVQAPGKLSYFATVQAPVKLC
jgi:hypothetical protein